MAEYASKGVAGTALGLGIAGTVGLVNQLSGCGNGSVLGGILEKYRDTEEGVSNEGN